MNISSQISLFKNCMDAKPVNAIPLEGVCASIMEGEFKTEVEQLRQLAEKKERDAIKRTLPAVTISGTFAHRAERDLIKHSGFIAIDVDSKDNPNISDWAALRDTLGSYDEVLFCALSVSGRGIFAIIPLAYLQHHKAQFEAIKRDFATIGLLVDSSCSDVSRLRVISYDPQACWNPEAKPYRRIFEPKPVNHRTDFSKTPEIEKLIRWTEKKHGSFTSGNRNHFTTQLAAACHRFGISQHEVENHFKQYSQADFTEREILSTIRAIYHNDTWRNRAI